MMSNVQAAVTEGVSIDTFFCDCFAFLKEHINKKEDTGG